MFKQIGLKLMVGVVAASLLSSLAVSNAAAAKVTVPGSPTFVMIKSQNSESFVKIKSKRVKVKTQKITVMLEKPSENGGAPVTSMVVQFQNKSCTIRGKANSCTIKTNPKRFVLKGKILASAVNKKGKSKRVSVFHDFTSGSWLALGYDASGKKFPSAVYRQQNTRVLNRDSKKWKKFQAISRSAVSSASTAKQAIPRSANPSVVFNITGTVGIALPSELADAPQSGLFAVRADGSTVDSLMPGSLSASVQDFYSAPNGRFYVTFTSATALEQGGTPCVLAEVNSSTGVPTCVDTTIQSVALSTMFMDSPPIQFDGQGNIYYTGTANSKFVLRKYVNGTVTDLINENISISSFIVLLDGTVIMKGSTSNALSIWLRRLTPGNQLSNLVIQNSQVSFVKRFADGNVYFGNQNFESGTNGVFRYLSNEGIVDPTPWFSNKPGARNSLLSCGGISAPSACGSPASISKVVVTENRAFGVSGIGFTTGELVALYPKPEILTTVIKKISFLHQVGKRLVLAGTNAAGTNMLTVFDPETYQETVIVDGSNETEIYSIAYVPSTGKLLFNGLMFSINKLVVGEVDLP